MKVTLILEKNGTENQANIEIEDINMLEAGLKILAKKAKTFTFNNKQQNKQIEKHIFDKEMEEMFYKECVEPNKINDWR